jgi:hypothetical protein
MQKEKQSKATKDINAKRKTKQLKTTIHSYNNAI